MTSKREAQLLGELAPLVDEVAAEFDVHVLDVELKGAHPRRVVRVVVDTVDMDPAALLDIDVVAAVSRKLGAVLDDRDPIPGTYTLEVTSPGADRRLTTFRDFARNRGRQVRIIQIVDAEASDGAGPDEAESGAAGLVGELTAVTSDAITLRVDSSDITVALDTVDHGKVVLPW
ncbi:MAG: hypothetical protein WD358_02310 [Nitriliruptoraceae bacterium]